MNKAKFLAACVCGTAASQGSAATEPVEALIVFECADFQVSPPEPKDRDPVYKATIKVGWNKNGFFFDISHSTLGGKTYVRSEQYTDTQVRKTPTNITWRGTQFRDPRKTMVGTFDFKAGHYVETIYSGNRIETKKHCTMHSGRQQRGAKEKGPGIWDMTATAAAKKKALDAKLKGAGKPPSNND